MMKREYKLRYINEIGDQFVVDFYPNEYRNLMQMLFDRFGEEWGECKGRGWCGTCHIHVIEDRILENKDEYEVSTLSKLDGVTEKSRLACQIPVNHLLNGVFFEIMPPT